MMAIVSVREVRRELEKGMDELPEWCNQFSDMFLEPKDEERKS